MGQKVNPHGLRVGIIKDWNSRWYADDNKFGDTLVEDHKIREFINKKLANSSVSTIEIERVGSTNNSKLYVNVHTAKPGFVIGKKEENKLGKLEAELAKVIGKKRESVHIRAIEIKNPDLDAQLVAENIASQLERRISFRRAMKGAMSRSMKMGAKGIKTCCSGRLGGAEIARTEHYHEGTIPLQTLRADIDYGFAEANTTYGRIGCKVWIYKGEILSVSRRSGAEEAAPAPRSERPQQRRRAPREGGRK